MTTGILPRRLLPQLMLLVVGILLLAVVAHAIHTQREQTTLAATSIENQARALARSLASAAASTLVLDSIDELDELLLRAADYPEVLEIQASDPDGRLLSHFVKKPGAPVARVIDSPATRISPPPISSDLLRLDLGNERLVAWYPVSAGKLLGWIRVDLSTQAIDDIRRRIWRSTLLYVALAVLGGSLLVFLFLRQPMAALERARLFAVDLESANGHTLPASAAPEEIEDLTAALNHASRSLHEQRQRLAGLIEQLGERNEQLNAIFTLTADGFISFDARRRVRYVNPGFTRLTGLTPELLAGLDEDAFGEQLASRCADADNCRHLKALRPAPGSSVGPAESGAISTRRRVIELKGAPGRVLEISLRTSATGSVSQVLHVRDITHENEVDRMKSEFLATAAHELRTPMASIQGFSELLLNTDYALAERQEMLAIIHRQSELMAAIINELLDLVRIEERRGKDFTLEALDGGELVAEAIANFRLPAGRQPPLIRLPATPCRLQADRKKLLQVLNNILANAYKYSPAGGEVTVALDSEADQVAIRISDRGIGMTEAQAGRVFERFYRADTSGKIPGTGLGMSIVREIVELHGGSVSLSSQPGLGTTVSVLLPQA
jgi:signal transduction histidine kinase